MKKKTVLGIVCLTLGIICLGYVWCAPRAAGAQARKGRKSQSELVAHGRTLFAANCVRCHGADGLSHTTLGEMLNAPNLTDAKWQAKRSNGRMQQSITRGRDAMPAFGDKLSREEIAVLVAYVRTLRK